MSIDNAMSSLSRSSSRDSEIVRRSLSSSTSSEYYVEVVVVADHTMSEYHGTRELEAYLFTLMNMVREMHYTMLCVCEMQCSVCMLCVLICMWNAENEMYGINTLICRMWLCKELLVTQLISPLRDHYDILFLVLLSFLPPSCFTHQVSHLYRHPSIGHAMNIVVVRTVILETEQVCHLFVVR